MTNDTRIAVLIPCYNEEAAIAKVVRISAPACRRRRSMSTTTIRSDATVARARDAGAIVRTEFLQGKGNVVRRMFADIEADIYVLVDGDDTYDAEAAPMLIGQADRRRTGHRVGQTRIDGGRGLSPRPCVGQSPSDRTDQPDVRRQNGRYAERLPHHVASLRQVVSLRRQGLRHRDGALGACGALEGSDGRSGNALQRAPGRLRQQAQHLPRRNAHIAHHRRFDAEGAAAGLLWSDLSLLRNILLRDRHSRRVRIFRNRIGAASSHHRAGHRHDGAGLSLACSPA